MATGIELIAQERKREIEKGFTAEHDQKYPLMALSAIGGMLTIPGDDPNWTPVESKGPHGLVSLAEKKAQQASYVELLVIAGALIAAELDRVAHANMLPKEAITDSEHASVDQDASALIQTDLDAG